MNKLLTILLAITLTSCTREYVNLIDIGSANSNIPTIAPQLFENDTLAIEYYFWAEGGISSFRIANKLNIPLYIDWKKSRFYAGNTSLPYWEDKVTTTSTTRTIGGGYRVTNNLAVYGSSANSYGEMSRPERISFIGQNTSLTFPGFFLQDFAPDFSLSKSRVVCMPRTYGRDSSKRSLVRVWEYTRENSPLQFRNLMTLATTEDFEKEFYIDNAFYLKSASLMLKKQFNGKLSKDDNGSLRYERPMQATAKFYYSLISR